MSSYGSGRRAPNMSEYIANLNTLPSVSESSNDNEDFKLFTTADFFDFDMGENISNLPVSIDFDQQQQDDATTSNAIASWNNQSDSDLLNNDFSVSDFPALSSVLPGTNSGNATSPTSNAALQPISPSTPFPMHLGLPTATQSSPVTSSNNAKRKFSALSDPNLNLEERTRLAAEEDKRRRNTAASARFRVKKKQREQALERTSKEMTEKATTLEKRVQELEMENRWLKGLITEKNGGEKVIGEMWAKFVAEGGEQKQSSKIEAL